MAKITLEQWRMFKAVADYGGFNQAASEIHKSQSSIHHAVSKLEDLLGLELFEAEGRRVYLTAAGQHMLRRANYLLDEANKLEHLGLALSQNEEAELKLAVDEAFPRELLQQALSNVSDAFPQTCIELHETILSGANELLISDEASIAISPTRMNGTLNDELIHIPFIAVASPAHPLHKKKSKKQKGLSFEDLKSHRQIVVRDSAISERTDAGWLGADKRWTVSNMATSQALVAKGLGYAWLPQCAIETELEHGLLKPLKLSQGAQRHATLFLNYKDADGLGPAAQTFISTLKDLAKNFD